MPAQQTVFDGAATNLILNESSKWKLLNYKSGNIEVYGTFGGATVEFDLSCDDSDTAFAQTDPNSPAPTNFAAADDESGLTVSIAAAKSDLQLNGIPENSRMRARVVGGDGTTSLLVRFTGNAK